MATSTLRWLATFRTNEAGGSYAGLAIDAAGNLYGGAVTDAYYDTGGNSYLFKLPAGTDTLVPLARFAEWYQRPLHTPVAGPAGDLYGVIPAAGSSPGFIYRFAAGTGALSTLVTFDRADGSGWGPSSELIMDGAGNLYGTTESGGSVDAGTVFRFDPATGMLTTLASFDPEYAEARTGYVPLGRLAMDRAGNLYGVTQTGPGDVGWGLGTVYMVAAGSGVVTTLASFDLPVGAYPAGGLILDAAGNLYGTTYMASTYGMGAVFRLDAATHALTVLAAFDSTTGGSSEGPLLADAAGNLYGTTTVGGAGGDGTVFRLDAATHAVTVLAAFSYDPYSYDNVHGAGPMAGLVAGPAGVLYGVTRPVLREPYPDGEGYMRYGGSVFAVSDTGFVVLRSPAAPALARASDTGVAGDGITALTRPVLAGTATVGSLVTLYSGADMLGTTTADAATGAWSLATALGPGAYGITATATDWSGTVSAASDSFALTILRTLPRCDLDGDGTSDILFTNATAAWDGTPARAMAQWRISDGAYASGATFATVDPAWSPATTGDFDGDGKADILWRHADGSLAMWLMDGTAALAGRTIYTPAAGLASAVAGTGDFNRDGRADILIGQETVHEGTPYLALQLWQMDGLAPLAVGTLAAVEASWRVEGVDDFDGDGRADILWRHADGAVAAWLMDGATCLGGGTFGHVGPEWSVAGCGDFDGDGRADILWRGIDGSAAIWLMDGAAGLGGATIGNPGTNWIIGSIGDFNSDGRADILWRQMAAPDSGGTELAIWLMDGLEVAGGGTLGRAGAEWQIA